MGDNLRILRYNIEIKASALKSIKKAPLGIQKRTWKAIWPMEESPRPKGVKKLEHIRDVWRMRVGGYRILYKIEDDHLVVLIVAVGPRGDIYKSV